MALRWLASLLSCLARLIDPMAATRRGSRRQPKASEEELLRALLDTAADGIHIKDLEGRYLVVNAAFANRFGLLPEQIVGKTPYDLFSPEEAKQVMDEDRRAIEVGTTIDAERWQTTEEGVRVNHGRKTPLRDESGAIIGVVTVSRDVTEQQKLLQSIRESRDFHLTLFQEFPAMIWRTDSAGNYDYFNNAWLSFTGRSFAQEIGIGRAAGAHPDDLAESEAIRSAAFGLRIPYSVEYRLLRSDGVYRWLSETGRPFAQPNGDFAGFIGTATDITERRERTDHLDYLATHDSLTGLPNRSVLEEALTRSMARTRRGVASSLLFLDVDYFKTVNDRFGHVAGDHVLVGIAKILSQSMREQDLLARHAGDEFAALLEGVGWEDAYLVAERARKAVEKHLFLVGEQEFSITISAGLVPVSGDKEPEALLALADKALYEAKNQGRNRVLVNGAEK